MADYLVLNGIDVPVLTVPSSRAFVQRSNRRRTHRGMLRDDRKDARAAHEFETPLLARADADAFAGLIQGEGYSWSFTTGLHADQSCLGFEPGYKHLRCDQFAGTLFIDNAPADEVFAVIDPMWPDDTIWSVGIVIDGSLQGRRGDGAGFDNAGARNDAYLRDAANPGGGLYIEVIDGKLYLIGVGNVLNTIDSLWIMPYLAPDDWFAQWAPGFPAAANVGPFPFLKMTGLHDRETPLYVSGEIVGETQLEQSDDDEPTGTDFAARGLSFRLHEVPPRFVGRPDDEPLAAGTQAAS